MAETVTIEGQPFLKRQPLGVLGLSFITLGIYFFYWYYKVNEEIQRFEHDESISPARSLMAILFGWIIIVPPFIAMYNTAKHVRTIEERLSMPSSSNPRWSSSSCCCSRSRTGSTSRSTSTASGTGPAGAAAAPAESLPGDPGTTPMPGPPSS